MPAAAWSRRRAPSSLCASAARSSCSTTSASTSTRWTGSAGSWSSKRSWMQRATRRRVAGEWPRSRRRSASARPTSSAPRTLSCCAVTRTCKDGALGPVEEGQYDLDQQANGACTFGFFCLEVCGSLVESVVVLVGQSRLVERGNLSGITVKLYTLHCGQPHGVEGDRK